MVVLSMGGEKTGAAWTVDFAFPPFPPPSFIRKLSLLSFHTLQQEQSYCLLVGADLVSGFQTKDGKIRWTASRLPRPRPLSARSPAKATIRVTDTIHAKFLAIFPRKPD
jgi:hypothetical protein